MTYFLFVQDLHGIVGFVGFMLHQHHPPEAPCAEGLQTVEILQTCRVLKRSNFIQLYLNVWTRVPKFWHWSTQYLELEEAPFLTIVLCIYQSWMSKLRNPTCKREQENNSLYFYFSVYSLNEHDIISVEVCGLYTTHLPASSSALSF